MRASFAVAIIACTLWSSLSLAADSSGAAAESQTDATRDAGEAMRTGVDEYRKGNLERARAAFMRAWRLKQHPAIAASLGDTEMKLGLYREAAAHWTFYLANVPPGRDRSEADQALAECRRHVASIGVAVEEAGIPIAVDGQVVGTSPLEVDLWLEPGVHSVSAQSADGRSAAQQVTLKAGDSRAIALVLQRRAPAAEPVATGAPSGNAVSVPPSTPRVTPNTSASSLRVPVAITGSLLTATAIAIGVVYAGKESGAASDVERYERQIDEATTDAHLLATRGGCSELAKPRPVACSALSGSVDSVVSSRRMKTIAFVGAGVLGVATVMTYLLWPAAELTNSDKKVSLAPWSDPGQGVKFSLRF
jgi:hypothetical protein